MFDISYIFPEEEEEKVKKVIDAQRRSLAIGSRISEISSFFSIDCRASDRDKDSSRENVSAFGKNLENCDVEFAHSSSSSHAHRERNGSLRVLPPRPSYPSAWNIYSPQRRGIPPEFYLSFLSFVPRRRHAIPRQPNFPRSDFPIGHPKHSRFYSIETRAINKAPILAYPVPPSPVRKSETD
jgi:hypothetical protein